MVATASTGRRRPLRITITEECMRAALSVMIERFLQDVGVRWEPDGSAVELWIDRDHFADLFAVERHDVFTALQGLMPLMDDADPLPRNTPLFAELELRAKGLAALMQVLPPECIRPLMVAA